MIFSWFYYILETIDEKRIDWEGKGARWRLSCRRDEIIGEQRRPSQRYGAVKLADQYKQGDVQGRPRGFNSRVRHIPSFHPVVRLYSYCFSPTVSFLIDSSSLALHYFILSLLSFQIFYFISGYSLSKILRRVIIE